MPERKKTYAIVAMRADGRFPIPAGVVADFGIHDGDLCGFRKLPDRKWELTFWRQLRRKGCQPTKSPQAPDCVAIVKKPLAP